MALGLLVRNISLCGPDVGFGVANLSSTIPGLSRSAVTGVVIARRGASTGLFRLAGRGVSLWTRIEHRDNSWFGVMGGDVERWLRKLLVMASRLGTHDDR